MYHKGGCVTGSDTVTLNNRAEFVHINPNYSKQKFISFLKLLDKQVLEIEFPARPENPNIKVIRLFKNIKGENK